MTGEGGTHLRSPQRGGQGAGALSGRRLFVSIAVMTWANAAKVSNKSLTPNAACPDHASRCTGRRVLEHWPSGRPFRLRFAF